ncbi:MAG: hypothetical protein FJ297_04875 [Planctomycetes bacterium]|nr:hypothetical protein [Planctomycetota bacterium]
MIPRWNPAGRNAREGVRRSGDWRRNTIGLLAVGLLIAGVLFWVQFERGASVDAARAFCIRVGTLFAVLWLALPQLADLMRKYPPWLLATGVALIGLVIIQPKALTYAIPAAGVLIALHFLGWFTRKPRRDEDSNAARS